MNFFELVWVLVSFVSLWSAWAYTDGIDTARIPTLFDEMEYVLGEIPNPEGPNMETESESEYAREPPELKDRRGSRTELMECISQEKVDKFVDDLRKMLSRAAKKKTRDAKFVVTNAGRLCNLEMHPSPFSEQLLIASPLPRVQASIQPLVIPDEPPPNITIGFENSLLYKAPRLAIEWQSDMDKTPDDQTKADE